jgi:hypothetical protein
MSLVSLIYIYFQHIINLNFSHVFSASFLGPNKYFLNLCLFVSVKRDCVSEPHETGVLLLCLKISKNDPEKTAVLHVIDKCHLNRGRADLACITHPMQTSIST